MLQLQSEKCLRGGGAARLRDMSDEPHEILRDTRRGRTTATAGRLKPVGVLKRLIEVFTDPGDVVIDPVAGSGTTLRAAYELGRSAYGFEVDKSFYEAAREKMLAPILTEKTTI